MSRIGWFRSVAAAAAIAAFPVASVVALTANAQARSRNDARAASAFDGTWSLLVETTSGECERSYRLGLDIVEGAVIHDGTAYGRVTPRGEVRVRVAGGDMRGEAGGRLSRDIGRGVWRGSGSFGSCSGNWIAQRRD